MFQRTTLHKLSIRQCLQSRGIQTSRKMLIKVGERLPNINVLVEDSPGNKLNLREVIKEDKALIIGVPAAFSPSCSNSHIPGYISHFKLKEAGQVFVVAVNDPFVTRAWADSLDPTRCSGIRFLGDPTAKFTEALDLAFDGGAIFGGPRSKRYALKINRGVVHFMYVEPDNTGVNVSAAKNVLG